MCDRTLEELIESDRLDYPEHRRVPGPDGDWLTGKFVPTGRMIPTDAGAALLDFIKRHLNPAEEA